VFLNHKNIGLTLGLIKGFAEAMGNLIAIMDDDDLMLPNRLSRQVEEFVKDPQLGYVACQLSVVNSTGHH